MPIRMFQELLNQVGAVIGSDFGVTDTCGKVINSSETESIGSINSKSLDFINTGELSGNDSGMSFIRFLNDGKFEYVFYLRDGTSEGVRALLLIASGVGGGLKHAIDGKLDKTSLIKDILLSKISNEDIYMKAKDARIVYDIARTVILVTVEEDKKDPNLIDVLKNVLADRSRSFVADMGANRAAAVVEGSSDDLCETIIDTLSAELLIKAMVSTGGAAMNLTDLGRSYREAVTAYEVGRIFMDDRQVLRYESLGLERLLHSLPADLSNGFLQEVFRDGSGLPLDSETLNTVMRYFDNSLNTSETARQLYIHRNTLLYRLEKVYKLTGLDLKRFEDAVLLKIAILLEKERSHAGI